MGSHLSPRLNVSCIFTRPEGFVKVRVMKRTSPTKSGQSCPRNIRISTQIFGTCSLNGQVWYTYSHYIDLCINPCIAAHTHTHKSALWQLGRIQFLMIRLPLGNPVDLGSLSYSTFPERADWCVDWLGLRGQMPDTKWKDVWYWITCPWSWGKHKYCK